jgi:hypothetical protein
MDNDAHMDDKKTVALVDSLEMIQARARCTPSANLGMLAEKGDAMNVQCPTGKVQPGSGGKTPKPNMEKPQTPPPGGRARLENNNNEENGILFGALNKCIAAAHLNMLVGMMRQDVDDARSEGIARDPLALARQSRENVVTAAGEAAGRAQNMAMARVGVAAQTWLAMKRLFEKEDRPGLAGEKADAIMEKARQAAMSTAERFWPWIVFELTLPQRVERYKTALRKLGRFGFEASKGDAQLQDGWREVMDLTKPLTNALGDMAEACKRAGLDTRKAFMSKTPKKQESKNG